MVLAVSERRACVSSWARLEPWSQWSTHHLLLFGENGQCYTPTSPLPVPRCGESSFQWRNVNKRVTTSHTAIIRMAGAVGLLKYHIQEGDNYRSQPPQEVNDVAFWEKQIIRSFWLHFPEIGCLVMPLRALWAAMKILDLAVNTMTQNHIKNV